ncbi:MAG TPA: 4-amino-4-deoxy-L-arabinose-phospho-UDP flippase [Gammaproteobacteria bacterium]|nr:4-amino-4-deoxy-L-arabinose-phospho-UDP flippase [Gammaproteobacteria bacterium]
MSASRDAGRLGLVFLLASIVLSAAGQLSMKAGMQELHGLAASHDFALSAAALAYFAPALEWTLAGLAAYGLSLLAWLAVLVRFPLSYAYPLLGISYVLVYAGATHWSRLMEPLTPLRTLGTLLILGGVALVSLGESREPLSEEAAEQAEQISSTRLD